MSPAAPPFQSLPPKQVARAKPALEARKLLAGAVVPTGRAVAVSVTVRWAGGGEAPAANGLIR